MNKFQEWIKKIAEKLGLLKNKNKLLEEPKGPKIQEANIETMEEIRKFAEAVTVNIEQKETPNIIQDIKELKAEYSTFFELKKEIPEIEKEINYIRHHIAPNDTYIENIFKGTIQNGTKTNQFVKITSSTYKNRDIILIPGEGTQEYIDDEKEEEYSKETNGTKISIQRNKEKDQIKKAYFSAKSDGKIFETNIQENRFCNMKTFGLDNYSEYVRVTGDALEPVVKETCVYNDMEEASKKGKAFVGYGMIYKNRNEKLPARIYLNVNGKTTIYDLDVETEAYINNEDKSLKPMSLEFFEEEIKKQYGIPSINNSKINQCFNGKIKFKIPKVIKQIHEACNEQIKEKDNDPKQETK